MRARDVSHPDDEDEQMALAVLEKLLARVDGEVTCTRSACERAPARQRALVLR